MVEEMESLHKNETHDLVKLPSGINLVGRKWVFKKKMNVAGQVEKFKARLVVKGYSQVEEVVQTKNYPDTMRFELRNEEYDSDESNEYEEEVEQLTTVIRRLERERKPIKMYSTPEFHSAFMLTTINDEPKLFSEAVHSTEHKL